MKIYLVVISSLLLLCSPGNGEPDDNSKVNSQISTDTKDKLINIAGVGSNDTVTLKRAEKLLSEKKIEAYLIFGSMYCAIRVKRSQSKEAASILHKNEFLRKKLDFFPEFRPTKKN